MTQVKICGLTRLEDALLALEVGADYLGFIFYPPSPRAITPAAAADLIAHLRRAPGLSPNRPERPRLVGVFVNEPAGDVAAILTECDLDLVQLSGDEDPALVSDPASPLYGRAYKALRPRTVEAATGEAARYAAPDAVAGPRLLLDTPHGRLYGGSGVAGDWGLAATLAVAQPRLMLAGGLTPDNVAEAIRRVRPYAVDVAGGVEAGPGRKDAARLRAFVAAATAA